jgi:RNA polymerase sigma factor (sigma-70 family)
LIDLTKEFWAHAYQTSIGKLIGICYRYTGNHQLSEDLAHDAFLKAIEKSQSFRGDGNFDAWLRRIVVNHVLQYLRNKKRNPYLQPLTTDQAAAISMKEDTSSTQPMEFTTIELLETVDQLPEHHRLVFNLYVLEKFSHSRIGEELGISEGTSKSHLARARKKLQQLLTEKIEIQKEEGNKEKAAILLFALTDDATTDQMFLKSFDKFSIPPENPLSLDFLQRPAKNILKKYLQKNHFR